MLRTRSLRDVRILAEQGRLKVSQEVLDILKILRKNGSRLEVAKSDLPNILLKMAELQRSAQVEFILIEQADGKLFVIRGLPREVDIPTCMREVLAHTHRGPPGFMKLRLEPGRHQKHFKAWSGGFNHCWLGRKLAYFFRGRVK